MNRFRSARRGLAPPVLVALAASLIVLAACSGPAAQSTAPSTAASVNPSVAATATAAPTDTPEPSPSVEPGIGTQLQIGDQQYAAVNLVEQWPGTDTEKPASGNVFVAVKITITGITTTSFTSADFSVQDASLNSYAEKQPGQVPQLSFQNGLEPQHFYGGFVTFEVPAAAAGALTLVYKPNFLTTTYQWKLF
jgi:hypothetical protein